MRNPWLRLVLALAVAAAGVFSIWLLFVGYIMRSMPSVIETAGIAALVVIGIAAIIAVILAFRPDAGRSYMAVLAVIVIAAGAPHVYSATLKAAGVAREAEERRAFHAKWLAELENYKKGVAARIEQKAPFSPKQSLEFLEFVNGSNLKYRSLPDHSAEAYALLQQALDAKVVDPNVRVRGKTRIDVNEEPLFVVYYNFYLKSGATGRGVNLVHKHEWRLLQMLIAAGANLDDPAAASARDVLKRQTLPYEIEGYWKLQ